MNAVKSGTTTTTTTSKPPPIVILGDVKMKEIPEMLLNKAMMNPGFGGLAYFLESFKVAFSVSAIDGERGDDDARVYSRG